MLSCPSTLRLPTLLAAMTLGLAGCYSESTHSSGTPATVPWAGDDTCGAGPLRALVGQPVSMLPEALKETSLRIIKPGQAVTLDYSASRINVHADRLNRITGVTCG